MKKAITAIIPTMAAVAAHAAQLVVGLVDVCPAEGSSVPPAYVNAFKAQGAEPRLLSWTNDLAVINKMVEGIDLLMLCGGEDVEPARYKTQPSPKLGPVNKRRDAFEWALLDAAVKRRKPVFGICRGHQMINVYFGGTLWQDLPSEFPVKSVMHRRRDAPDVPVHGLKVEPDGFLFRIFGEAEMRVNSSHHQAVKKLAPGFSICARSPDGVVEAIADEKRHVHGVQFHPERMFTRDAKWGRLFKAVVDDAARAKEKN